MTHKSLAKSTYSQILKEISDLYVSANKALATVYWQIGKRIVVIEQNGEARAQYGAGLLQKLSQDLTSKHKKGFSITKIKRIRRFYLDNQKGSTSAELPWSKAIELLSVKNKHKRNRLEALAKRKNLTCREIRKKAKKINARTNSHPALHVVKAITPPKQLQLNTYTLMEDPLLTTPKGMIKIDCGFFVMLNVDKKTATAAKSAYTYSATVERVVDGDTLKVFIDIGFGIVMNERLRMRGIDTPELSTPEGKKAKQFVQKLLKPGQPIVIKTSKTDLYGRFVADVLFLPEPNSTPSQIIADGIYLNSMLVEKGVAKTI